MIIKFMGIIDLLTALILILVPFNLVSWKIVVIATSYLLFKAYAFKGDFASILDGASGIYLFLTFLGFSTVLTPVFGIYLIQKSVFSLV